jgi:hypothetical protein
MTEDVAECAVACGNTLGEAATWCTRYQCLYGRLLDTLFATNAREGADTQMLQADTGAGNLWRFHLGGITGLVEACFAGTPSEGTLRPPHSPSRTTTPHTPPDRFGSTA